MTKTDALKLVSTATSAKVLFYGTEDDNKALYRSLSMLLHPDKNPGKPKYADAFVKLSVLYGALTGKLPAAPAVTVGSWVLERPLERGTVTDLYLVNNATRPDTSVLKIARSSKNNDLLLREKTVLDKLLGIPTGSTYHKHLPVVRDSFMASGRRANILSSHTDCFSLDHIVTTFQPTDFRHVVWMMNRLLSILGYAHGNNCIHGAVTPDHLLYRPIDHGLVLVDWCCSVDTTGHIPLIVDRWKAMYPPEVVRKQPVPQTDIYMAAECMLSAAINCGIPKRFRGLLDWCLAKSPASRPRDAWDLQEQWKRCAEDEYGAPKFVKFEVPTN